MSLQDLGLPLFDQLIITSDDALANKRNEVKALLRAELMGWQKDRTDPGAGAKLAVDTYGKALGLALAHEPDANTAAIELQNPIPRRRRVSAT